MTLVIKEVRCPLSKRDHIVGFKEDRTIHDEATPFGDCQGGRHPDRNSNGSCPFRDLDRLLSDNGNRSTPTTIKRDQLTVEEA